MTDHLMQPSPEQFADWLADAMHRFPAGPSGEVAAHVARKAYAAGADAELEACLGVCRDRGVLSPIVQWIRDARRPKPLSLKEQALIDLEELGGHYIGPGAAQRIQTIRKALEALNDD